MRMLVVSSPHGYTTRDVWKRVIAGLAANGCEALGYDILPRWGAFETMLTLGRKKTKDIIPEGITVPMLVYEPIVSAALLHDCEAILIVSPQEFYMPMAGIARKAGLKTIAYFTECPYENILNGPMMSSEFDYVLVNDRYSVGLFRSFNERTFYLPHSFDPMIHFPPAAEDRNEKVVFVGTGYGNRRQFFRGVNWKGIDLELRGLWDKGIRDKLRQYIKGWLVENEQLAEMYRQDAVGISIHRLLQYVNHPGEIDMDEAYSVGPRTYELAACGCFQISDYRQELVDIFEDSVPIYRTPKEMESLIRRAVDDPVWRQEMAGKQRQAVQGRDCTATMKTVLELVA